MQHRVRCRTKYQAPEPRAPMRANDDEIGPDLLRKCVNHAGWFAMAHVDFVCRDAMVGNPLLYARRRILGASVLNSVSTYMELKVKGEQFAITWKIIKKVHTLHCQKPQMQLLQLGKVLHYFPAPYGYPE